MKSGDRVTDEQLLIDRAQRGEMDAFRELVERSKIIVYRMAYDLTGNRHDAEDLSQEAYIRAYRSIGGFRGGSRWTTWLYRILVNLSHDRWRKESRRKLDYIDTTEDYTAPMQIESSDVLWGNAFRYLFPLTVGHQWRNFAGRQWSGTDYEIDTNYVSRMEKITLPFGTLDSYVIRSSASDREFGTTESQRWYSPEIGLVQVSSVHIVSDMYVEWHSKLVRYHIGQRRR
jgi:RNA polymerase sigma factor (sigma-70 family)